MARKFELFTKSNLMFLAKGTLKKTGVVPSFSPRSTRFISKSSWLGLNFSKTALLALGPSSKERDLLSEKLKDPKLFRPLAFVNDEWFSTSPNFHSFDVIDPSEDVSIASIPDLGGKEATSAILAAHNAFKQFEWSESTVRSRHDLLMKLHKLMLENELDLATIITKENGKPLKESLGEVNYAASFVEWFAEEALRTYGDVIPSPIKNSRYLVMRQPIGVAAIITPWNFPLAMITRKVAAALAAGCTVVIKPAPETPLSALAFAELAQRSGFPKGVINVITTSSFTKEVGEVLCTSPLVSKISFTGSTAVGKILMASSADTMKKLSLELGGNAPFMVFGYSVTFTYLTMFLDDADLDAATEGTLIKKPSQSIGLVAAKFRNAGQTCVCPNRVYVQRSIHDNFISLLTDRMAKLKVGSGFDPQSNIGPLINLKAKEKVMNFVEDAISKEAAILFGGKPVVMANRKGFFYSPTILSNMDKSMAAHNEEIFGPLITIYPFETEEEGLKFANDTKFGLAAYAYTRDIGRAFRVSEKLQAGMVAINSGTVSAACAPFGGVKESGIGREGSKYGINEYTEMKFISLSF